MDRIEQAQTEVIEAARDVVEALTSVEDGWDFGPVYKLAAALKRLDALGRPRAR